MTTLEVIPNENAAIEALQRIEMIRCLSLLEAHGLTAPQLRLNISDTYYSVARKIVKAYVKQAFPSSANPQVLTRYIKLDMIPIQSRICLGLYSYQDTYRDEVTLLRFIEPVRVALEAFHQSLQTYRNYLYVQTNSTNATYYVRAGSDEFMQKRGSLKEHLVGILNAVKATKEALDNVVLAIGDYEQSLEIGRALKVVHDEKERLRQANAVADICTKLTGIGYGPFATASTAPTPEISVTGAGSRRAENTAAGITRAARDAVRAAGGPTVVRVTPNNIDGVRQQLAGTTFDHVVIDEIATMPRVVFMDEAAPVTPMPQQAEAPAESRTRDINGNVVRPAEPELQARLNQILREQGVVR